MRDFFRGFVIGFNQSLDSQAGRVGLTPRAFRIATLLFWALVFSLLFAALPARAQVASLCGSGKVCSSSKFVANVGSQTAPSYTWAGDTDTGFYHPAAGQMMSSVDGAPSLLFRNIVGYISSPALNSNVIITESVSSLGTGTQALTCTANYCTSAGGIATGSAGVGTAFASFPAAASSTSKLLYDSTNNVQRTSDGTNWVTVGYETAIHAFFPAGVALGTNIVLQEQRVHAPAKVRTLEVTGVVAGTGAGSATVEVFNSTSTTQMCTITYSPCSQAAGSTTSTFACTGAVAKNDVLLIRTTTTGCATSPAFNVAAVVIGG